MALANDVAVINAALLEIGESVITARADATDRAKVADKLYDETLDEVLADAFWQFAKKYTAIAKSSPQPLYIPGGFSLGFDLPKDFIRPVRLEDGEQFDLYSHFSSISAVDETPTLSTIGAAATFSAVHGLAIDDFVYLTSGTQKAEIRQVTAVPTTSTATLEVAFTADQAALTKWKKASGSKKYLITDAAIPNLEYIARVTSPLQWEVLFSQALIKRLASRFALAIVHSRALAESLISEYTALLSAAEGVSGQSTNRPRKVESNILIDVRRGGSIRSDKVIN